MILLRLLNSFIHDYDPRLSCLYVFSFDHLLLQVDHLVKPCVVLLQIGNFLHNLHNLVRFGEQFGKHLHLLLGRICNEAYRICIQHIKASKERHSQELDLLESAPIIRKEPQK